MNSNNKIRMKIEQYSSNDCEWTIIIGKNKEENWKIIDDASPTDIWFHMQDIPSCHVILKTTDPIKKISKDVLTRCALLCKINSKAKNERKTSIIYSQIENVRKTKNVGEVIVFPFKTLVI